MSVNTSEEGIQLEIGYSNEESNHSTTSNEQILLIAIDNKSTSSEESSSLNSSEFQHQEVKQQNEICDSLHASSSQSKTGLNTTIRFQLRNESERKRINALNTLIKVERDSLNRFQDLIRQSDEAIKNRSMSLNSTLPAQSLIQNKEMDVVQASIKPVQSKQERFLEKLRAFSTASDSMNHLQKRPSEMMNSVTIKKKQLNTQIQHLTQPNEQTLKKGSHQQISTVANRRTALNKIMGENIKIDKKPQQVQKLSKMNDLKKSIDISYQNASSHAPIELTTYQRILREHDNITQKPVEKKKLLLNGAKPYQSQFDNFKKEFHNGQLNQNGIQVTNSALSTGSSSLHNLTKEKEQKENQLAYGNIIGLTTQISKSRSKSNQNLSIEFNQKKCKQIQTLQNQLDTDATYLKALSKHYEGLDETYQHLLEGFHIHSDFLLLRKEIGEQFQDIQELERKDFAVQLAVKKAYDELEYWENKGKPVEIKVQLGQNNIFGNHLAPILSETMSVNPFLKMNNEKRIDSELIQNNQLISYHY